MLNLDRLVARAGAARFALLGEATHGTHEFYALRAEITKRLVTEHGFRAVAAEAGWPDAYRVNCYVRGAGDDADAEAALADFRRFSAWMWRNEDVLEFVRWLREFNDGLPASEPKVGFYGLDLYSLYGSIAAVVAYLEEVDPEAATRARERYACLEHFGEAQAYGYAASVGADACEDEAVAQLVELRRRGRRPRRARGVGPGLLRRAERACRTRNAEAYYRSLYRGRASSWNLRDWHMYETLRALADHLTDERAAPRIAVWAHNSHLGDARATAMTGWGELNLGQYEALLHDWGQPEIALLTAAGRRLRGPRLQRAIGVVYRPDTERGSEADLPRQFDALIHLDETTAVAPLERAPDWERGELPDTYPFAV